MNIQNLREILEKTEEEKIKLLKTYQFPFIQQREIIKTLSINGKIDVLLENKKLNKFNKLSILKSLDIEHLSKFLVEHKEFCSESNIHPYEIVYRLNLEQQIDFITNLENMNLTLNEKREILAILPKRAKPFIDTTNFPKEYITAFSMNSEDGKKVHLDLKRNLEDYRGLDNLISINSEDFTENLVTKFSQLHDICPKIKICPEKFTEEQRTKLMELCSTYPDLQISTNGFTLNFISTAQEYKEAEEWINSIINNLNPEYSKAQKMAIIDYEIGKKISYSPDFDTEIFNQFNCRALWKVISSGYGVCNGISKVEQYIFSRIGIESELIVGDSHVFLKIKDIELPLANGEVVKGNTILDPTWNLTAHRFGGKPNDFCISYEQARKNDIDSNGKDHYCHKNDLDLQDTTLNLDEQSLRNLFTSVGLADKNGQFPIQDLLGKSDLLHYIYANEPIKNINNQLKLLSLTCPEFAICQNSTMTILSSLLNNENLKFNKCVVNRVYDKTDKEKSPNLFVYIDLNEFGKKFYFADKNEGQFVELPQEKFTKRFECYEEDLKNNKRT